eukprot:gene44328-54206_t
MGNATSGAQISGQSYGGTIGLDGMLPNLPLMLGGAINLSENSLSADSYGASTSTTYGGLSLYGLYEAGPAYLSAIATLGYGHSTFDRNLYRLGLNLATSAGFDGTVLGGRIEAGYTLPIPGTVASLTPFLAFQPMQLWQGAATESFGTLGNGLTYDATSITALPTYLERFSCEPTTPTQGGYSKHLVVREEFVLRVPEGLDLSKAAPLLCAGITTYSPLRTWNVGPGSRVGVVGLGGLGHMAVKLAAAMGADVTVLSRTKDKEADALALGADLVYMGTRFIATQESNAQQEFKQMVIDSDVSDLVYTDRLSGVHANFLKPSLEKWGVDVSQLPPKTPDMSSLTDTTAKLWKDLWSAGQGVATIHDSPAVATLVTRIADEYDQACQLAPSRAIRQPLKTS